MILLEQTKNFLIRHFQLSNHHIWIWRMRYVETVNTNQFVANDFQLILFTIIYIRCNKNDSETKTNLK